MGQRGPVPAPDNVRFLKAAARVSKSGPGGRSVQSQVVKGAPTVPTWLDREAKAEWRRVVPVLEQMGLLAGLDRAVLASYCDVWSQWNQARDILRRDGQLSVGSKDQVAKHPAWDIYRGALVEMRALWKDLALTPTARVRLLIPDGVEDDHPAADLLD